MVRKLFFIFITSIMFISCINEQKDSKINGNWYYIDTEYDEIIEGYDYVEMFFNNSKGYMHSYANDIEKFEFKIFNDTIRSSVDRSLDYGLIKNFTKDSFTLTSSDSDENLKMFNLTNNEGLFTLEDYFEEKCSLDEYYDSYYKRKKKYYYKK